MQCLPADNLRRQFIARPNNLSAFIPDLDSNTTDLFNTLALPNPSHDVSEFRKIQRSPDIEATQVGKGRSDSLIQFFSELQITG